MHRDDVLAQIHAAFAAVPYPGDPFLVGSTDGSEPHDEVAPFRGRTDWSAIEAPLLDRHAAALSFFSDGAFRFFLPAYLVADLADALQTADPTFHLTHGFSTLVTAHEIAGRRFDRRLGPDVLLNPRRYGAMTWRDHVRRRLAVFAREEAAAIVAYLEHRRAAAETDHERAQIDAALADWWRERARTAPTQGEIARHLAEEAAYADALRAAAFSRGR